MAAGTDDREPPPRRRAAAEWLVLPLFALPVAVAIGALAYARSSHLDALDAIRRDGAALAARRLSEDPGRGLAVALLAQADVFRDGVRFRRGDVEGVVRRRVAAPGPASWSVLPPRPPRPPTRGRDHAASGAAPWIVAPDYPAGLRPDALGDPAVRLAVESGTPIARSGGADAGTAALAELVASPSPEVLRAAPLPAGMKLHLARRLGIGDAADLAALEALRDLDDAVPWPAAGDGAARPAPGAYEAHGTRVLVLPGERPVVVAPRGARLDAPRIRVPLGDGDGTGAVLRWDAGPVDLADGEILWRGRLAEPVAGTWSVVAPAGRSWWSGDAARWAIPVAALALASLAVPSMLLVELRRRRRLDEARARFLNEVAHDLRTPVAALRLHAELLASGRVADEDRAMHAAVVGREAARLSALLGNLLDLSRLDRGRAFERSEVDVAESVRDAVREFGALHPRREADVRVECPERLVVAADRAAVARCLANLLDNAGKFSPEGAAIRVRAEAEGAGARIVVEDDGPGLDADERSRVFLPYERGSAAARTAAPGTGLGLALVRELVAGMGGTVAVLDAPRGAAFEVRIPGGGDEPRRR